MLENIKAVVFDLDGTIYYGDKVIEGAIETINCIRNLGKKIFYLTNNSTKTRKQIYEKLMKMGIVCEIEQVFTSGYVAAIYAENEKLENIFVLGSENLKQEFKEKGINVIEDENKAENLLIGYDTNLDYEKITKALNVALKGNTIIACNKERHFPGKDARRIPGCGAMVGVIELCANKKVDFVIGKPNTLMLDRLAHMNNLSNNEILMVGDTYESDIIMADDYGCKSILIGEDNINTSTLVVDNISDIIKFIK